MRILRRRNPCRHSSASSGGCSDLVGIRYASGSAAQQRASNCHDAAAARARRRSRPAAVDSRAAAPVASRQMWWWLPRRQLRRGCSRRRGGGISQSRRWRCFHTRERRSGARAAGSHCPPRRSVVMASSTASTVSALLIRSRVLQLLVLDPLMRCVRQNRGVKICHSRIIHRRGASARQPQLISMHGSGACQWAFRRQTGFTSGKLL